MSQLLPEWSRVEVNGKSAEAFAPDSPRFGLIWLHGQDDILPSGNAAFTALLNEHRFACLAPHGRGSWWVDRICTEFDESISAERFVIEDVLSWMNERWRLAPRFVGIAGVEMGGQGALRLALKRPKLFPVAAGLGGALDFHELVGRGTALDAMYDSRERARQDTATLHMHPTEWPPHLWFACEPADPWFRGNDRLHEKLRAYGVPHTADLNSSGRDYFEAMLAPMLAFIANGVERESRRLM